MIDSSNIWDALSCGNIENFCEVFFTRIRPKKTRLFGNTGAYHAHQEDVGEQNPNFRLHMIGVSIVETHIKGRLHKQAEQQSDHGANICWLAFSHVYILQTFEQ